MSVFGDFPVRIFPTFGLYTKRYGISLRFQPKCGKIRTRKTPHMNSFYAVRRILRCATYFDISAKRCYLFEPQRLLEEEIRYSKQYFLSIEGCKTTRRLIYKVSAWGIMLKQKSVALLLHCKFSNLTSPLQQIQISSTNS